MTSPTLSDLIKTGNTTGLEAALKANPALADGKNEQGISYLLLAAYYRNEAAVNLIKEYKTPLDIFEASATGDLERVKELVSQDKELLNTFSHDGFTPLGLSTYFGQLPTARFLIEAGADVNMSSANSFKVAPLHSATAISHYELTKLLLDHGAQVNARQSSGVTPLHSAAHNGQLAIAQLLVASGADVNAKSDNGQTPSMMAEEKGFKEVASFIRAKEGK